jgi:hypothetical protein
LKNESQVMVNLPRCKYPSALDIPSHGIQRLPENLPLINLLGAQKYRSTRFTPLSIQSFKPRRILEMSRMIAKSFVEKEPMNRHLQAPEEFPKELLNLVHTDPFGSHPFGQWNKENIFFWFIRLMVLTDSSSSLDDIPLNEDLFKLSLAIQDENGKLIGGAYNIPLAPNQKEQSKRTKDPFIRAIAAFIEPPLSLIIEQENIAIKSLEEKYPSFKSARENGKVGCHFMVARTKALPMVDAFELVAASSERFLNFGYFYLVVSATNEWTGAACEVLGGLRVHFAPYRAEKKVKESKMARAEEVHSTDGFLSDKDSGSMFYLIKLR